MVYSGMGVSYNNIITDRATILWEYCKVFRKNNNMVVITNYKVYPLSGGVNISNSFDCIQVYNTILHEAVIA